MAGVCPREERSRRACHRHADARLEDAVALGDSSTLAVEMRLIERMGDDAAELACRIARQPRIGIERQAISHGREHVQPPDLCRKAGVRRAAEEAIELLDLAALSLPADPRLFADVPLPIAVEQKKPIVGTKFDVEPLHARAGTFEDRRVVRHVGRARVDEITEYREMNARIEVADGEDFEMFDQPVDASRADQHRGHDHHRAGALWNAFGKIEARQALRRDQAARGLLNAQ